MKLCDRGMANAKRNKRTIELESVDVASSVIHLAVLDFVYFFRLGVIFSLFVQ